MSATQAASKTRKSQAKADSSKKKNKSTKKVVVTEAEARKAIKKAEKVIKQAQKELAQERAILAQEAAETAKAHKEAEKAAEKAKAEAAKKIEAEIEAQQRADAMRNMTGPMWLRRLRWEARQAWAKVKRAARKVSGKVKAAAAFAAGWAAKTAWPTVKTWAVRYTVPAWAWVKSTAVSIWVWSTPARAWVAAGFGTIAGLTLFGSKIAFVTVVAAATLLLLGGLMLFSGAKKGKGFLGRVKEDLKETSESLQTELKNIEAAETQVKEAKAKAKAKEAKKAKTTVKGEVVPTGPNQEPIVITDKDGNDHVMLIPEPGTEPDGRIADALSDDNAIALNSAQQEAMSVRMGEVNERLRSFEVKGDKDGISEHTGRQFTVMMRMTGHGEQLTRMSELFREHYEEQLGPREASDKFNWTAAKRGIREEIKVCDELIKDNEGKSIVGQLATV